MHKLIVKQAVETIRRCQAQCLEAVSHCLKAEGDQANVNHINLLLDCVKACEMAADYMARHTQRHPMAAEFCMRICEACANECEKFKMDDFMKKCAKMCRDCVKACAAVIAVK